MPPPPPELTGWIDFIAWGIMLFIVVIAAVVLAGYMFRWLRSLQPSQAQPSSASMSSYENEVFRELLQEIRALRKEISELRHELRE